MRKIKVGSKVLYQFADYDREIGFVDYILTGSQGEVYALVDADGDPLGYFDDVELAPTKKQIYRERLKNAFERWRRWKNMSPAERARSRARAKMMADLTKQALGFGELANKDIAFYGLREGIVIDTAE